MKYNSYRRKSAPIKVGSVGIGGDFPVSIQSMLNTDTHDVRACFVQISKLEEAGCDIVRLAVPDIEAANTFSELKNKSRKHRYKR